MYYRNSEDDHACTPAAANHPRTPDTDRLCIALHYLSLSPLIEEIDLKCDIVISSDLFWPTTPGKQPYWASLRSIEIVFNITTPGGGWYFDWGPQWLSTHRVDKLRPSITGTSDCMGESEDEQDLESEIDGLAVRCSNVSGEPHSIKRACGDHPFRRFRFKPNAEKMNVLLVAAGRAAGQMPWLRCMCLRTCQFGLVKRNFKLYYLAPGVDVRLVSEAPNEPNLPRDASGKPRLYLAVGDLYDPSEEVIATWKKSTGRDLVCKVWTP